jgi:hypothetical protein
VELLGPLHATRAAVLCMRTYRCFAHLLAAARVRACMHAAPAHPAVTRRRSAGADGPGCTQQLARTHLISTRRNSITLSVGVGEHSSTHCALLMSPCTTVRASVSSAPAFDTVPRAASNTIQKRSAFNTVGQREAGFANPILAAVHDALAALLALLALLLGFTEKRWEGEGGRRSEGSGKKGVSACFFVWSSVISGL